MSAGKVRLWGLTPSVSVLDSEYCGFRNLTVPYVQNRAIMFDSTYFHRTDDINFKPGYKNRRINVTFLYGKRRRLKPQPAVNG